MEPISRKNTGVYTTGEENIPNFLPPPTTELQATISFVHHPSKHMSCDISVMQCNTCFCKKKMSMPSISYFVCHYFFDKMLTCKGGRAGGPPFSTQSHNFSSSHFLVHMWVGSRISVNTPQDQQPDILTNNNNSKTTPPESCKRGFKTTTYDKLLFLIKFTSLSTPLCIIIHHSGP